MNRANPIVLALAAAVLLGAASAQDRYADPQGRFTTPVPVGWTSEATPDVVTFRHADPEGVVHVLAPVGGEAEVVAAALAILVDRSLDAAFAAAPLQTTALPPLPSGTWTQRVYQLGADLIVTISQERGGYTVLVLAQATQAAFMAAVNAAVNQVLLGFEVLIPEPEAVDPADLPYLLEEVAFASGEVTLVGALSLPEGDGPHPALALVPGSGPQDRDGLTPGLPGYASLRWLADHLTREGFAVLRWDERGVGASTGDQETATSTDLADDVEAGIAYLRGRPEVAPDSVGVLGHSEGGLIAAMVAARAPEVAFVIGMAAPAVPYSEVVVRQVELLTAAAGASPEEVARAVAQQARVVELALAERWDELEAFLVEVFAGQVAALTEEQRAAIGDVDAFVAQQAAVGTSMWQVPWWSFFLRHDPAQDWARVTVPVLALFGGLDLQVDPEQNREPLEEALAAAGNDDVTVVVFPQANHLFQQAVTGHAGEYLNLEMAFLPGFLEEIGAWLGERFLP